MDQEPLQVPISALEHYSYCPRQCALIHVERIFAENLWTTRGRLTHERVHARDDSIEQGIQIQRGLPLYSDQHGLVGKADLVEMRASGPYPVEYKSGRRHGLHADVQLCAQALCLEDMYNVPVCVGAIYYATTRTRHEVDIGESLRSRTIDLIERVRGMLQQQIVPPPVFDGRCRRCSLRDDCLPGVIANRARLRGLQSALFRVHEEV